MMPNERRCEVCDKDISKDPKRCTNGRCGDCHSRYCTPGGNDSPGHGRGTVVPHSERSER